MTRRLASPRAKKSYESPLDRAAGYELVWQNVAELFDAARLVGQVCFVYFIGEEDGGAVKIGSAKDPILRLRGLQTGNPRRLRVEYALVGDHSIEFLFHELWERFAVKSKRPKRKLDAAAGTEWFTADIRETLEPILKTAAEWQAGYLQAAEEDIPMDHMGRIVREAHTHNGFVAKGKDEVRLLGLHGGYVNPNRRSRI